MVDGAVEAGGGIGVAAEVHAEALEELDDIGRGKVLAAVERHVLEEVGEAALVLVFVDGADLDGEAGADAAAGFGVAEEGVAQAVVELAPLDGRVDGQVTGLVGKIGRRGRERRGQEQQRENERKEPASGAG